MNCPVCDKPLESVTIAGFSLEICQDGCGGIWFERFEIEHFDGQASPAGDELEKMIRVVNPPPKDKKHLCPRCMIVVMRKRFYSIRKEAQIDECAGCGGLWVDGGELAAIRKQFRTSDERAVETKKYYDEIFKNYLAQHGKNSSK